MRISNDISNADLTIVISKANIAKKIFQFRPKTFFNAGFPAECLIDTDESITGYFLQDSDFVLTLEELNSGLNSDFESLDDFFASLGENEFLIL